MDTLENVTESSVEISLKIKRSPKLDNILNINQSIESTQSYIDYDLDEN